MNAPEDPNGLREALARAEARAKKAERALVSLTPDGSEYYSRVRDEYHVDVDACLRFIGAAREDKHALVVRTIKAHRAAEAEITRLKEGMEAALRPFAEAWDGVEAVSEQGAGYVQDDSDAWVSGNASGGSYPLFKFGDLRRASEALDTLSQEQS